MQNLVGILVTKNSFYEIHTKKKYIDNNLHILNV
jgi:hypothetical protein